MSDEVSLRKEKNDSEKEPVWFGLLSSAFWIPVHKTCCDWKRWREEEKETIPLIHLASLCRCLGPVVTSEIEDEHERELQRSPFTDSKKSAPNYSESKYQFKQATSPFSLSLSSRLPPPTRPEVGWDADQQPFDSLSDGSNMALMLIHLVFWPALSAFLPSRDSVGMCCCGSKAKHSKMLLLLLLLLLRPKLFLLLSELDGKQTLWPQWSATDAAIGQSRPSLKCKYCMYKQDVLSEKC